MFKLETERLILRDLETDDVKLFYDMSIEEKITKYQRWFLGKNGTVTNKRMGKST